MHVVICSRYKLLVVQALKSRQAVARGTSRFGEPRYRVRRRRVRFHLTFLRSQNESPMNRYAIDSSNRRVRSRYKYTPHVTPRHTGTHTRPGS